MEDVLKVKNYIRASLKSDKRVPKLLDRLDDCLNAHRIISLFVKEAEDSAKGKGIKQLTINYIKLGILPLITIDIVKKFLWLLAWILLFGVELLGISILRQDGIEISFDIYTILVSTGVMVLYLVKWLYDLYKEFKWTRFSIITLEKSFTI